MQGEAMICGHALKQIQHISSTTGLTIILKQNKIVNQSFSKFKLQIIITIHFIG